MTNDIREENVFKAKLSEQAERYDEMVEAMKKIAQMGKELTVEERNLLSVAFKNVIGSRRASWRILSTIEQREESKWQQQQQQNGSESGKMRLNLTRAYRTQIEAELEKICDEVLEVLDTHLIDSSQLEESRVFYLKMKGDYYRYRAEFATDKVKEDIAAKSLAAYDAAWKIAEKLNPTQPIRLGLALNFSVFYYEIMSQTDKACELAKNAFDKAIEELDSLTEEESYKDSTLIMQLLRDNLTLWKTSEEEDQDAAQQGNAGAPPPPADPADSAAPAGDAAN